MMVKTKEQVLTILREHQRELRRFGAKRCGVFGSFVRNEPLDQSDHGYFGIDYDIVWDVIANKIPVLDTEIKHMIIQETE